MATQSQPFDPSDLGNIASVQNNADSTEKQLGGCTGKGFMPGESGNPAGRPRKKRLTELYERLLDDPDIMPQIETSIIRMITSGRMVGQLQLKEMAERVEGKVTQTLEVDMNLSLADRMTKARERADPSAD